MRGEEMAYAILSETATTVQMIGPDTGILMSVSATIFAIFGGFILTFSFSMKQKKLELDVEIELSYHKMMFLRREMNPLLLQKIITFEEKVIQEAILLKGETEIQNVRFTSNIDHQRIKRMRRRNKKSIRKVYRLREFVRYSADFENFKRNSCITIWWFEKERIKEIYEVVKRYEDTETYVAALAKRAEMHFTVEELDTYYTYLDALKPYNDKVWNLSLLVPSLKNQGMMTVALIYLSLIAFFGLFEPLISPEDVNVKENLMAIFILTLAYIPLSYLNTFTHRYPSRLSKEIKRFRPR